MIKLIICGALGRMGQSIINQALVHKDFSVIGGVISPKLGQDIPAHWDFPVVSDINALAEVSQGSLIVDFSHYSQLSLLLSFAHTYHCSLLVGTTAHPEEHKDLLNKASKEQAILVAPNTSIMANLLILLSQIAAQNLPDTQAHILDLHHNAKKDAPSGTALAIKKALNKTTEISSLRLGNVCGEHSVYLVKDHERLELSHRVSDRVIFAQGALLAANFLSQQGPGLYDMTDVINLNLTIKNRG